MLATSAPRTGFGSEHVLPEQATTGTEAAVAALAGAVPEPAPWRRPCWERGASGGVGSGSGARSSRPSELPTGLGTRTAVAAVFGTAPARRASSAAAAASASAGEPSPSEEAHEAVWGGLVGLAIGAGTKERGTAA